MPELTTSGTIDKALEGLGDDLKPLEEKPEVPKPEGEAEEKPKEIEKPETPEEGKDPKEDKGYTADELELEAEEKPTSKVETPEVNTDGLTPEAKYIVDNLPYLMARIKDGDEIKEVQVKSWTQLPQDVEFASKRDELAFMNGLTAQENRALSLQQQFQNAQGEERTKAFKDNEDRASREDIAKLQKAGELPKFTTPPEDSKFNEDPATVEIQKVLDLMNKRNDQYLAEANQGRPYRHIGFEEAFYIYQRENPKTTPEQKKEDKERKDIADEMSQNHGLTSKGLEKPRVKSGTRIEQILDRIDQEWQ